MEWQWYKLLQMPNVKKKRLFCLQEQCLLKNECGKCSLVGETVISACGTRLRLCTRPRRQKTFLYFCTRTAYENWYSRNVSWFALEKNPRRTSALSLVLKSGTTASLGKQTTRRSNDCVLDVYNHRGSPLGVGRLPSTCESSHTCGPLPCAWYTFCPGGTPS